MDAGDVAALAGGMRNTSLKASISRRLTAPSTLATLAPRTMMAMLIAICRAASPIPAKPAVPPGRSPAGVNWPMTLSCILS